MASRRIQWTPEKYRIALRGDPDTGAIPGLRSTVHGFTPDEGFDLRRIADWTPAQKRRVQHFYGKVAHLYAQPRLVLRPRRLDRLHKLQADFQGDIQSKAFKVAFIPDAAPGKPVTVRYLKRGIVLERKTHSRYEIPFDKARLATDPKAEIGRVIQQMPGAKYFYVQAGAFTFLSGSTQGLVTSKIIKLMQQYDGKQVIPKGSGNYKDPPKWHKWDLWLDVLHGYKFPKNQSPHDMAKSIDEGMQAARTRRDAQQRAMKSKRTKRKSSR